MNTNNQKTQSWFQEQGFSLSDLQVEQFIEYQKLLLEWNEHINLTRVPGDQILERHFLDSLQICKTSLVHQWSTVIDFGSGAGLPGIPLKIYYPELQITLLDSRQKRVSFLEEVIRVLHLKDIRAIHNRAEDFFIEEPVDVVIARAFQKLPETLRLFEPFLVKGSTGVIWHRENWKEEATEVVEGSLTEVYRYRLSEDVVDRVLLKVSH